MSAPRTALSAPADAKSLGAYYTDRQIADFLAAWAIRSPATRVLDPCFGGGVFLRAAAERIQELAGIPRACVFGFEINADACLRVGSELCGDGLLRQENLECADFFSVEANAATTVDAVIGNPPFIRYQRFSGEARRIALQRSSMRGVRLPELSSAWAPFLVHCVSVLRNRGRLAVVLPMEIAHAKYARPVLEHVRHSFETAVFVTFRKKLFPGLNEETILLLADNKGGGPAAFLLRDMANSEELEAFGGREDCVCDDARPLDAEKIGSGSSRIIEHLIPDAARQLYLEIKRGGGAQRLASLADVGIGYVTGANDFFHLSPSEATQRGITAEFLKPAVRRGRALCGLRFTEDDWKIACNRGEAGYLLHIDTRDRLPVMIRDYVLFGESLGVDHKYKCRTRTPWFRVPHVYRSDAFLTYMSGAAPRLVANHANAYAPNSLHLVRLRPLSWLPVDALAALWQTSLTRLSVEIEGHALGGGMLKLEPSEAKNVLVPAARRDAVAPLRELSDELNEMVRQGQHDAARLRADDIVLKRILGLTAKECGLLASAANCLSARRGYGGGHNGGDCSRYLAIAGRDPGPEKAVFRNPFTESRAGGGQRSAGGRIPRH
jgi:adenine-specific DNA methylase